MNIPVKITGFRSRIVNAIIDAIRAREVVNSEDIVAAKTPSGTKLRLRKTWETLGFPFGSTRFLWGVDILPSASTGVAIVRVGAGAAIIGGIIRECDGADVNISEDTQYVCARYQVNTDALIVSTATHTSAFPQAPSGQYKRWTLYKVTSTLVDDERVITSIIPFTVGVPVWPMMPKATNTGDQIRWNNGITVTDYEVFTP